MSSIWNAARRIQSQSSLDHHQLTNTYDSAGGSSIQWLTNPDTSHCHTYTTTTYHQYTSQSLQHYCYTDINPTCATNVNPTILWQSPIRIQFCGRIRFCVFNVNAGLYSSSILHASIYVENAESDSAGRIQLDSAFYKMLLVPGRFIKILPHLNWELKHEITFHYLFLLVPGRFIKILPHFNWEIKLR